MSLGKRIISGLIAAMLLVSCGADDPTNPGVDDQTVTTEQGTPTTAGY